MLKEAFQYLTGLGDKFSEIKTVQIEDRIFTTQNLNEITEDRPSALVVSNLSGLVDYLKSNYDNQPPVLIQVKSPVEVNVFSTYNRNMKRNHLIQASALLPDISFGRYMDVENFNVLLQSCFVDNEHRTALLSIIGNIREDNVAEYGDDGTSQQVTAKAGIATQALVPLPNPVRLKPFRTFVDIEQPESKFVFRMRKGPEAALFEADGGAWKLDAIHDIRDFLGTLLAGEIASKKVTIIA